VANATDVLQPRLIVLTLSPPPDCLDVPKFADRCPHVHNNARDPKILVVKGGTVWARISW